MKRFVAAGIAGLLLSWLMAAAALAYDTPIASQITLTGRCESSPALTATVLDNNGKPVPDEVVTWTITSSPSAADTLGADSTKSDSNGVARNTIHLDSSTTGTRVITVAARDASASLTLDCSTGGLPRTDTAPDTATPMFGLAGAMLVLLMGLGFVARRSRA